MSLNKINFLFLFFLLVAINFSVLALPGDTKQPIEIEADFAELDDEKGETIYVGNVIVTQGSLKMMGDKLRILLDKDREIEEAIMTGRPATFIQKPQIDQKDVEGESKIIEYKAREGFLYLIDKAKVTQGKRLAQGFRINYDINKKTITIRSSRADIFEKDLVEKEQSQRVKIIIPADEE